MLIGITGRKGSGKDTLAEGMGGFHHTKFAGPLKMMLARMYALAGVDHVLITRKLEGDLKEVPCDILGRSTPRKAMQYLGSEWAKLVDPSHELWVRIWEAEVKAHLAQGDPVVVTDVRFPHELKAIQALGGYTIKVVRHDLDVSDQHESETEIDSLDVDLVVHNTGSIEDLHSAAGTVVDLLNGAFNGHEETFSSPTIEELLHDMTVTHQEFVDRIEEALSR